MKAEYIGWIKETKAGRFKGVISLLVDVDEPDGDRLLAEQASSQPFEDLALAQSDLQMQCDMSKIPRVYKEPRRGAQIIWESEFPK